MAIRVLLADDHETVRQGLRLLIDRQADMEVVGEAANGRDAVAQASSLRPDVVLIDMSMPDMNGLQATRAMRDQRLPVAIVALTRYSDAAYAREMFDAGASGYVLKQSAAEQMLQAIRAVASGKRFRDSALGEHGRISRDGEAAAQPQASIRERDVLKRMAQGHSNKEIAAALDISVKTVEVHKANAMRKLGLKGRIDIVKYAVLQGWLNEP
jgi:two-component system response regulator NreC